MPILNPHQKIQKIAGLLRKLELFESRFEIARQIVGQTKGLRQMEDYELDMMYNWANQFANGIGVKVEDQPGYKRISKEEFRAGNLQRKKIISMAHTMRWENEDGSINMSKINEWCKKYGQYHKPLNYHTKKELSHLVTQFENLYNSFVKQLRENKKQET